MTLELVTEQDSEKMKLLNVSSLTQVEKNYSLSALKILKERYLLKDNQGNIVERPDELLKRVAVGVGIMEVLYDEEFYDKEEKQEVMSTYTIELKDIQEEIKDIDYSNINIHPQCIKLPYGFIVNPFHIERLLARYNELLNEGKMRVRWSKIIDKLTIDSEFKLKIMPLIQKYYDLMANCVFLPNTPALMNCGTKLGMNAACFTLRMKDDLDHIYKTYGDIAKVFKAGGGIGINYSELRPEGAFVKGTGGKSSGTLSWLKGTDETTGRVAQGGKRRGASMAILNWTHDEIEKFIEMKSDNKSLLNHNISVCADKSFFDKALKGGKARDLLNKIVKNAWISGDPGMVFLDNMNSNNLLEDVIGSKIDVTNPCVTGDTRLATAKGLIRMEDLYLSGQQIQVTTDDRTQSMDGKDIGVQLRSAVPVFKTSDNADVWTVETDGGYTIEATDYHKFFVQKSTKRYQKKEIVLKELQDLNIGDRLLIQSDEGYFGNQGSKDLGSVIGWWQADGTSSKTMDWKKEKEKTNIILDFYHEKKELAEQFKNFTNNILPKSKSISGIQNIEIRNSGGTHRNCCSLASTRLGDLFENLQIMKNKVPEIIWQGSRECVIGYLQALFTADGTVNISCYKSSCNVRLSSIHYELLKEIQILLGNFGIQCSVIKRKEASQRMMPKNDGTGEIKLYNCKANYELIISGKNIVRFSKNIGFLLNYKQEKLDSYINTRTKAFYNTYNYISKIKSITYKGKEAVYDTTEPLTHTIIINSVVSSQCSEISMYPYESCILASINLSKFVKTVPTVNENEDFGDYFDYQDFGDVVQTVTQFLDSMIDATKYPIEEINEMTKKCRRIGVGFMGLADALVQLGIPYNSEKGFKFTEEISRSMTTSALHKSNQLARQKGAFPLWYDKKYPKGKLPVNELLDGDYNDSPWTRYGLRNCSVTTVAPTGTLSMLADCSHGIEPLFSLNYTKKVTIGDFEYLDKNYEKALKEGRMSQEDIKKIFVTAKDIHPFDHLMMQAVAQKWITNGISKTINMSGDTTEKMIEHAYVLSHALGNKGISIYRDRCKGVQVLNDNNNIKTSDLKISDYTVQKIKSLELPESYKQEILKQEGNDDGYIQYNFTITSTGTNEGKSTLVNCEGCGSISTLQNNGSKSCFICLSCGNQIGSCS